MRQNHILITLLAAFLAASLCPAGLSAQNLAGTYKYAQRDTCDLYFDVYDPVPGSETTFEGKAKPTLLFVYGGGFVGGFRSNERYFPWFKILNEHGYKVITIDYRLGLKGVEMKFNISGLIQTAKNTIKAQDMGVEDLFSAVNYIHDNAEALGVDPKNIVLVGNSSGAIISLAAEYYICNREPVALTLPDGFNFKGLIAFAGAIVGNEGKPKYQSEPCPTLMMHGTVDSTVQYNKTQVLKLGMWGSNVLDDIFAENKFNYSVYRFVDHSHDIADNYVALWPFQSYFLEQNVISGRRCIIDATIDDPTIPKWEAATLDSLY